MSFTKAARLLVCLSALFAAGCITPKQTKLQSGTFEAAGSRPELHHLKLEIAEDRSHANLHDGDKVVRLDLQRRADPDDWVLSCGQHFREETFDVARPVRLWVGGREYVFVKVTGSCGGNIANLYVNDLTGAKDNPRAKDTLILFGAPANPPLPPRRRASSSLESPLPAPVR